MRKRLVVLALILALGAAAGFALAQQIAARRAEEERRTVERARAAFRSAGPQAAFEILDPFVARRPESADAQLALALLYQSNGYPARARDAARIVSRLKPGAVEAWQVQGMAAMALQDEADAEAAFRQATARGPDDWRNHAGLGEALAARKKTAEARAELEAALRLAPDEPQAGLSLGRFLLREGEQMAAREILLHAAEHPERLTPESRAEVALALGRCFARTSRNLDALLWLRRAEALAPHSAEVQYELIRVCRSAGYAAGAEKARGRHRALTEYHTRVDALVSRIAGAPDDLEARLTLARLHAANGARREAIKAYGFLLLRAPNHALARRERDALNAR